MIITEIIIGITGIRVNQGSMDSAVFVDKLNKILPEL